MSGRSDFQTVGERPLSLRRPGRIIPVVGFLIVLVLTARAGAAAEHSSAVTPVGGAVSSALTTAAGGQPILDLGRAQIQNPKSKIQNSLDQCVVSAASTD